MLRRYGANGGLEGLTEAGARIFAGISELLPAHVTDVFPGEETSVAYVTCPFIPGHSERGVMREITRQGFEISRKHCEETFCDTIVALGGFTSIFATDALREEYAKQRVYSTSGSFLTAASIWRSLHEAAEITGKPIKGSDVAVLGASGDIGSKVSFLLARDGAKLRLSGSRRKLDKIVLQLECGIEVFSKKENPQAVQGAQYVVAVTSSTEPVISVEDCSEGVVICDAGYPKNIFNLENKEGVLVFPGGLVETPEVFDFSVDTGLPQLYGNRVLYGCWGEGVVLGREGVKDESALRFENRWCGEIKTKGLKRVVDATEEILEIGERHGIRPASIKSFLE
jgi:predicted amino acid dehydrogenase